MTGLDELRDDSLVQSAIIQRLDGTIRTHPHCPLQPACKPEGAWLDALHRALDEAVATAYGWPATISDDDVLTRLLA
jgi:hypothetical protein